MNKDGSITIGDWNKGMVKHPIFGFGLIQGLEVFEDRGIAKLTKKQEEYLSTTQMPVAIVKSIQGSIFTLTGYTGSGSLYKNGTEIQTGLTNAWDLCIWHDYLWVSNSSVISAYGPLSAGANAQYFGNIVTGFETSYWGKMIVGQDDYLYRTNGNLVEKLEFTSGGTVGVAPVIASNAQLDLKDGQFATTLVEYGDKIMIGTGGGANYADHGNFYNGKVYGWNRENGTLGNSGLADFPVDFNEKGVHQMISHANKLFVVAGVTGNIYMTDGTNYTKIATIPAIKTNTFGGMEYTPNAISISTRGTLLIGNISLDTYTKAGIWEIDINDSSYPVVLRNTISSGDVNSASGRVGVSVVTPFATGWRNLSDYGVDTEHASQLTSGFGGVIESRMFKVGRANEKGTFQHLEWCLSEPLVSGQSIRISFRKNNVDDYTLINTWDYATLGAIISFEDIAGISDGEYIQVKIELDQETNTLYGSNINLISVNIW